MDERKYIIINVVEDDDVVVNICEIKKWEIKPEM